MPYLNLNLGDRVIVTVTGVIEQNLLATDGGQFLQLRHGDDGRLLSTVFVDDDSVDIAFDESAEVRLLDQPAVAYDPEDPNAPGGAK